jgi:hypothetical protein
VPELSGLQAKGLLRVLARRAVAGGMPVVRGEPANGCAQLFGMI